MCADHLQPLPPLQYRHTKFSSGKPDLCHGPTSLGGSHFPLFSRDPWSHSLPPLPAQRRHVSFLPICRASLPPSLTVYLTASPKWSGSSPGCGTTCLRRCCSVSSSRTVAHALPQAGRPLRLPCRGLPPRAATLAI